ncbi:MAG: SpoIID/LytB domain-containing protein [Defluviitaleaceae bacterium]|nr:SpoIID/LytB domain-containing protein [Defluviitaleaceae bacterium]
MTLIIFASSNNIFAEDINNNVNNADNTIRIGLESRYTNAWNIGLGNTTLFVNIESYAFFPPAHVYGQDFRVIVDNNYYLHTGITFGDFPSANSVAYQTHNGVVGLDGTGFSVLIGPFSNFALAEEQRGVTGHTVVPGQNSRVTLTNGGNTVLTSLAPLRFADAHGGFMHIGGRSYRGLIEMGRHTGQGITPVNIVDVEEYLFSVVPSEMPALWHIEALKAQAVAARSFTYYRRGSHNHLGYELCDTIFSQVYSGVEMEHYNSTMAVEATRGVKAFHGGSVILATYFSSSGGFTENSENVWIEALPYLRAIEDRYEEGALEWERAFTLSQIGNLASGSGIGTVRSVAVTHNAAGRVESLILNGASGRHYIERENIRTFFAPTYHGSLPSRNFTMPGHQTFMAVEQISIDTVTAIGPYSTVETATQNLFAIGADGHARHLDGNVAVLGSGGIIGIPMPPVSITESTGYTIVFTGRGWGHGVGMSQFGANSMAELGFNHVQILQHYYTGIEIRQSQ